MPVGTSYVLSYTTDLLCMAFIINDFKLKPLICYLSFTEIKKVYGEGI